MNVAASLGSPASAAAAGSATAPPRKRVYPDPAPVPTQEGPNGIRFDFNDGFRVTVPDNGRPWKIRLSDLDKGTIEFEAELRAGGIRSKKRYYARYRVEVWQPGEAIFVHDYSADSREVLVQIPVGTLGDPIGWLPYAVKFRDRHGCKLSCALGENLIAIFRDAYPDITFLRHDQVRGERYYASYCLGLFFDDKDLVAQPRDFRQVGLHRTAGYILGVDPTEAKPRLTIENDTRPIAEPYVCISVQSTTQAKYWNNPEGWSAVVAFLKEAGYRVVCIDQKAVHGQGEVFNHMPRGVEDETGDKPLAERIRYLRHAAFFVGLSSGLAWLAWAADIPVVMISGFTHPINEFHTPYRVINFNACNSCWNDSRIRFDHYDFLYCPRHKNTPRQFECTRLITADQVKAVIRRIPGFGRNLPRNAEATESNGRPFATDPDQLGALIDRANQLHVLDRLEEALAGYEEAIALGPGHAEALYNRGVTLYRLKRFAGALASYDAALAIRPQWPEAWVNRGVALQDLNRFEEALASYDQAFAVDPKHADALNNRAMLLLDLARYEQAIEAFERLLRIAPEFRFIRGLLLHTRMQICDWRSFADELDHLKRHVRGGACASSPFALLSLLPDAGDQLACARTWVRARFPASPQPVFNGERYGHDRIRVAYLSADFHERPMAHLMAGVFEHHDRSRFETIALSFGPDMPGEMRTRLETAFGRFIDVRHESDRRVATRLRELEVDIVVDLMGFTQGARSGILALRPAPLQVNYLGYPATMGASYMDYIIADRFVIPQRSQNFYAEQAVYLPDTFQANDSLRRIDEATTARAAAALPENGFVFCAFNGSHKITPAMFDIWMRLLRAVEGSVLWLVGSNAAVERHLRQEAEHRSIGPGRLVFAPKVPYARHLARYRLADLFLDTSPFNAGTTASDALWAGLPLLTVCGEAFASRMAGSLLHAAGLPELVTHSLADYEAAALRLAREPKSLAALRTRLAQSRATCPLFDTEKFTRHLETAYVIMWQRHQRGEPPASFDV